MPKVIEAQRLTRKFNGFTAVNGINFSVKEGEIFGFVGPNGAGKTTTISMITTLLAPTSGSVTVAGADVQRHKDAVRRSIGIIFQDPSLDIELTAWENLWFHGVFYGMDQKTIKTRAAEVLQLVELEDRRNSIVKTFSGGMKRRLEIARGLMHEPKILFLDEPTLGLDPQTRAHIWTYITALKKRTGMTIFLTTHYLEETEQCDRIAIIDKGEIQALGSPAELKRRYKGKSVEEVFLKVAGHGIREEQLDAESQSRERMRLRQGRMH